jgi:deoxyribose-phosphate aldolase
MISRKEQAKMIDHTNIRPTATAEDIKQLCGEAIRYGFNCVVANPTYVPLAVKLLKGTTVKVCTTIGFPFGVTLPKVKAYKIEKVAEMGDREFNMVINLGMLKSKDYDLVKNDVKAAVDIKHAHSDSIVKVTIATSFLSEEGKSCCMQTERRSRRRFREDIDWTVGGQGDSWRC